MPVLHYSVSTHPGSGLRLRLRYQSDSPQVKDKDKVKGSDSQHHDHVHGQLGMAWPGSLDSPRLSIEEA